MPDRPRHPCLSKETKRLREATERSADAEIFRAQISNLMVREMYRARHDVYFNYLAEAERSLTSLAEAMYLELYDLTPDKEQLAQTEQRRLEHEQRKKDKCPTVIPTPA
jgi:hypothetical protein